MIIIMVDIVILKIIIIAIVFTKFILIIILFLSLTPSNVHFIEVISFPGIKQYSPSRLNRIMIEKTWNGKTSTHITSNRTEFFQKAYPTGSINYFTVHRKYYV